MTIKEFIEELREYPEDTVITVDGFADPELDFATIADFDVAESRRTGFMAYDKNSERRVLCIMGGDDKVVSIDVNGYTNPQPFFITYDHDGIRRSG